MSIYIPYTYLIGWSETGKFYYGVRYAKNCNPKDLFTKYFTSSKHVKNYINVHGYPDIIQIRKIFFDKESAVRWEFKVLNKMNLKEDSRFLNATNNSSVPPTNKNPHKNLEKWLQLPYEEKYSKEARENISRKASARAKEQHSKGLITYEKPKESRPNYQKAAYKRWANEDFRNKQKQRKWYYNDALQKSRLLLPEEVTDDWIKGRKYY